MKANRQLLMAGVILVAGVTSADIVDPTKPGFKEISAVNVPEDETASLDADVIVGEGGEFRKTGKGTLVLPLSRVNRQLDWGLTASEGTLRLQPGEDATLPAGTPPAAFQKAAAWFDASSALTTNGANGAAYVRKWIDVRDLTNPESPKHVFATPAWGSNSPQKSVPPVTETKDGRQSVYFGGPRSGKHMNLSATISGSVHQFVVHGAYQCFGPIIGHSTSKVGMTLSAAGQVLTMPTTVHFAARGDLNPDYAAARHTLDGVWFDPYSNGPKEGFQLLSTHFQHRPGAFNKIFRSSFEVSASGDTDYGTYVQGGDYVSEIVVFTNRLSSGEVLDVGRYLMRKWNLPQSAGASTAWRTLPAAGRIGVAEGAAVDVASGAGQRTPLLAFDGDGEVVKTGAGTLEVGPASGAASGVSLNLSEGEVLARGGRLLPVAVAAGETYTAAMFNAQGTGSRSAETDIASGESLTRASGGATDEVVKAGNGFLRVNAIDPAVKTLKINEGVVQLEAKSHPGNRVAGPAVVDIPNGDFEAPVSFTVANGRAKLNAATTSWRSSNELAYIIAFTNADALAWFGDSSRPRPRPSSGAQVLLLSSDNSRAEIDVTFPRDGDYQLELNVASRYGVGKGITTRGGFLQVKLGDALPGDQVGGDIHPSGFNFARFRIPLPDRKAKKQILRLQGRFNDSTYGGILIDDVRIVYLGKRQSEGTFAIPNGDFETVTESSSYPRHVNDYSPLNVADGWTFACTNSEVGAETVNAYVGLVHPGVALSSQLTLSDERQHAFLLSDLQSGLCGSKSLLFLRTQAYARTTFRAPKGRFVLKGNLARNPVHFACNGNADCNAESPGIIHATLTLADKTVLDLGRINLYSKRMVGQKWPTTFEIPSEQDVTLNLEQMQVDGSALVDNLVFVSEAQSQDEDGILKNGGCEGTTGWSTWSDRSYFTSSYASSWGYDQGANTAAYGYAGFEGKNAFAFQCCGTFCQRVSFPEKGLYQFTCHVRTRASSAAYSGNAIRFWYAKPGSSLTNVIDTMPAPYACNFVERSYRFVVPEAGAYDFGMSGQGVPGAPAGADRMTFLDGVSIRRVTEEVEASPDIPSDLKIVIADGARLVLDFTGTNTVRRVKVGTQLLPRGIVNAERYPNVIGGPGALLVEPNVGLVITVR